MSTLEFLPLTDRRLWREDLFIDGAWCPGSGGNRTEVINPASGEFLASVADAIAEDVRRAIDAADRAFHDWSRRTAYERAAALRAWHDLILQSADDLATILTAEQGKPLAEARGEIVYGATFVEWSAEEAKRVYGETVPASVPSRKIVVLRQPVGVCAAITPWNFPSAMILRKASPALPPVARSSSSRPARLRSPRSPWPTLPTVPGCPPACSTSSTGLPSWWAMS